MVLQYPDINAEINTHESTVIIAGELQKVRPKTFELLQTLIAANGELVSKEVLLSTVWHDVVVDEQVVFQSIKELRKLFPGQTIIKTVPRKGYAWLPKTQSNSTENSREIQPRGKNRNWLQISVAYSAVALFLLAIVLSAQWYTKSSTGISGSVVVLPVQSDINTNDHDWVRYGLMDQVISRLKSTKQAGVLQTDYVLDVIKRADISAEDLTMGKIQAIFDVSGAELVIAMRLTGAPNDYQIVYTLYQRNAIEKGVLLNGNLHQAADKLATLVGKRITPDYRLPQNAHSSSFTGRLIAEALETKSSGDIKGAATLLKAAQVAEPSNLLVSRLLLQTMVETGKPPGDVQALAEPALQQAEKNNDVIAQIRLHFWFGVSEVMAGDIEKGKQLLEQAKHLATLENDWLYQAYIEEIRGRLHQSNGRYSDALKHFQQAMEYHQILHCPLGQSNTLMHLSRLAHAQQNKQVAIELASQALDLVQYRNLSHKLQTTEQWLAQLTQK